MLRIVADTNVYVSALNFGGVPDEVLTLSRRGAVVLFISKPIIDEIEGVLKEKFQWPASRIREALALIGEYARKVDPQERVFEIKKDEPDNRVLECALAAEATVIVSGDSHLRDLGAFRRIRILSPRAFLDAIKA